MTPVPAYPTIFSSESALVRSGRGVISATMATVMVRYMQMASSVTRMAAMSSGRLPMPSATAMSGTDTMAMAEPARMNGVRRPSLEPQRSDRMPKSGSRNSPNTLSTAMTAPVMALSMPNVLVRILGTKPSNTCQKLIMPMNGRDASMTARVLSAAAALVEPATESAIAFFAMSYASIFSRLPRNAT